MYMYLGEEDDRRKEKGGKGVRGEEKRNGEGEREGRETGWATLGAQV